MHGVGSYGIAFPRKRWRTAAELRAENAWLREELARRDAELQRVNAELAVVAGPSQNSLITGLARQWAQVSAATLAGGSTTRMMAQARWRAARAALGPCGSELAR